MNDPFEPPRATLAASSSPSIDNVAGAPEGRVRALGAVAILIGPCVALTAAFDADFLLRSQLVDSQTISTVALILLIPFSVAWIAAGILTLLLRPLGLGTLTALAALGVLAFPVGTLFCPSVLYLSRSAQSRQVCTPEYRRTRKHNPPQGWFGRFALWSVALFALGAAAIAAGFVVSEI